MTALLPLLCAALLLFAGGAWAQGDPSSDAFWYGARADGTPVVRLHYFYSPTCPHCKAAEPFLQALPKRLPWLEMRKYSIKDNRANARFYYETGKRLGVEALSTPGFAFCRQLRIGYDQEATTGADLERALRACYESRVEAIASGAVTAEIASTAPPPPTGASESAAYVPFIGRIDAQRWSLPVLTVVLAGADAFNPCAFFVLLFLLSLLVHARSRARMLLIGGTFVLFSGLIYFIFMSAWLNIFLLLGELRIVTLIAGLLALVVGVLNVKDYFWFKQGPSLSIPDSAKPGLFRRMREVVAGGAVGPMLASTVVLAIVANSYELLCTAGFPMVYTRALTLADLQPWQHYAWLALYNLIYVLPLLAIVLVFTWTMGSRKLSESEGRTLKLASGFMMLGFGVLLLTAPQLLTNALASLGVLAAAVSLSLLTTLLTRRRAASA